MQVYGANDVAEQLQIKTATLRKYCILMEKEGYSFQRNSKGHRFFSDKDVMTLRSILKAKENGITLVESIKGVLSNETDNSVTNEISATTEPNTSDIDELKDIIRTQTEYIKKQYEGIQILHEKIDQQQQTINNMTERLEAPKEDKGFFKRLFNK